MMKIPGEANIRLKAKKLLASKAFGDAHLQSKATLLSPLPVVDTGGGLHSWWVPLTVGDRLVGFFQFLKDGTYMRYSSFQRHQGNYERCPLAEDWLDPDKIATTALQKIQGGVIHQVPYLTYDKSPDRITWAVYVTDTNGIDHLIYVTGNYAYKAV